MRPLALLILLGVSALHVGQATAQDAPAAPCASDAFRQLDFWVGDWDLSWTNPDGSTSAGSNRITRDEYGDCVIYERFTSEAFRGMSVSTFHAAPGIWRQTWVDDTGGYFALTGGPSEAPDIHFQFTNTRLSDTAPWLRMIWQSVTEDSLVWRWQRLPAGADPQTDAWQDRWVINYRRKD